MNKQEYISLMEGIKKNQRDLELEKKRVIKEYIDTNMPCKRGDEVIIKTTAGRTIQGFASQFGVLVDKGVYVTAYVNENGKGAKYITAPYASIETTGKSITLTAQKEEEDGDA